MAKRNLVYSTDKGRLCPGCSKPIDQCNCKAQAPTPSDGFVRIQRQIKGRNGKPVVIISGIPATQDDLKKLAKKLKTRCGVGGTVDQGDIVIQGDKRDVITTELQKLGYKVKQSGG